jgi:hypothetical protein
MYWKPAPKLYPPQFRSRIRKGRGVGRGVQYKSWLKIKDVPSQGTSSSVRGICIERPYHALSQLETIYLYLTERKQSVIDIREQWPILDIDRTLQLCEERGVRHAYNGPYPEPFTIDFLVTEQVDGQTIHRAASIKTPEAATDVEVRKRLAVEHIWCQERQIPWFLVDTSSFDRLMLDTLRFMRTWFRNRYEPEARSIDRFSQEFLSVYLPNRELASLLQIAAKRTGITPNEADDLFRYCAWTKRIDVSLRHPLSMNWPLVLARPTKNA